jgi:glutaredoxin
MDTAIGYKVKKHMLKKLCIALVCLALLSPLASAATGDTPTTNATSNASNVTIYFFYLETCPHCHDAARFLDSIKDRYPLEIKKFEVTDRRNAQYFESFSERYNVTKPWGAVPGMFINDTYIIGYASDSIEGAWLEDNITRCVQYGCRDAGEGITYPAPTSPVYTYMALAVTAVAVLLVVAYSARTKKKRQSVKVKGKRKSE